MDLGLGVLAIGIALVVIASHRDSSSRLARVEHKVNLLLRHSGIDLQEGLSLADRVKDIARDPARRLEAIKVYGQETGSGLAAAKQAVETYVSTQ
jgi:hypothetical protein